MHATDIKINEKNHTVTFKLNGKKQVTKNIISRVKIRRGGIKEQEVRPVVFMDVEFGGRKHKNVKFTLADRSHMTYKVLVGVRFLVQAGVQVDPSDMSAAAKPNVSESINEADSKYKTKAGKTKASPKDKETGLPRSMFRA
jgi:hypothetical protein